MFQQSGRINFLDAAQAQKRALLQGRSFISSISLSEL